MNDEDFFKVSFPFSDDRYSITENEFYKVCSLIFDYKKGLANQGSPESQYLLGKCYKYGIKTNPSDKKAFHFLQLAGKQGFAPAEYELGRCYLSGRGVEKSEQEAIRLFELAASKNNKEALFRCGLCYEQESVSKKILVGLLIILKN